MDVALQVMSQIPIPWWALRRRRTYQRALATGLTPVCPAEELLLAAHRQTLVCQMERMARVSPAHFEVLYRPVITRFAGFVQHLPAVKTPRYSGSGGLLDHGLALAQTALKLRRTQLLPDGAASEVIKQQTDLWSYATLTAALMHDIATPGMDFEVTLFDQTCHSLGPWNPWVGPMPKTAHWYRMRLRRERYSTAYNRAALLLVCQIVPEAGLQWLSDEADVFAPWLACVAGDLGNAGALGSFVAQADARCGTVQGREESHAQVRTTTTEPLAKAADDNAPRGPSRAEEKRINRNPSPSNMGRTTAGKTTLPEIPVEDVGKVFLQWLVAGIKSGRLEINTSTARVHRVNEGLLLVSPALFMHYAQDKAVTWEQVQRRFQKLKLHHRGAKGSSILTYSVSHNVNRGRRVKGMVITNPDKLGLSLPAVDTRFLLDESPGRKSDASD